MYLFQLLILSPHPQIYVTTRVVRDFGLTNFVFIISQLQKLVYNKNVGMIHTQQYRVRLKLKVIVWCVCVCVCVRRYRMYGCSFPGYFIIIMFNHRSTPCVRCAICCNGNQLCICYSNTVNNSVVVVVKWGPSDVFSLRMVPALLFTIVYKHDYCNIILLSNLSIALSIQ